MQYTPKLRVSMAGLRLRLSQFTLFARNVVAMLTANPNYTTAFPPLADVTAALDDLEVKAESALSRDRHALAARNAAWAVAVSLMRQLASYVQAHCQNDLAIRISSGFLPTKTPAPVGPLAAPQNVRVSRSGIEGQLVVRFRRLNGVTAGYTVQTAKDPAGPYADYVVSSRTNVKIEDCTPLTTYWVRVRGNGADGTSSPWSEPTCAVAL